MFAKLTTATLMTSWLLIGCSEPVATDEPVETLTMDERIAAERAREATPEVVVTNTAPSVLNLTGTYAMSGVDCDFIAGTLTISETSIRLSETICEIAQSDPLDNMTMSYTLSGCQNDAGAEPDRTVIVTRNEAGNISVTKWSDQTSTYNVCG